MIHWILVPQHAAAINLIGFAVGGIGLVLTIIGVAIALKQLSALKTETEATAQAVRTVQFKVSSLDTVKECQAAASKIASIRESLKSEAWLEVLAGYEFLIDAFLRLSYASEAVDATDKEAIVKMTRDMAVICERVRHNIDNPNAARRPRGQDQALRNFSDMVTKILFVVERGLRS